MSYKIFILLVYNKCFTNKTYVLQFKMWIYYGYIVQVFIKTAKKLL